MDMNYNCDMAFISIANSFAKQKWLKERVGIQKERWHLTSPAVDVQRWHFDQEEDLILFILQWQS